MCTGALNILIKISKNYFLRTKFFSINFYSLLNGRILKRRRRMAQRKRQWKMEKRI